MPFNITAQNLALEAFDETATAGIKYIGVHTLTDPGTGATANGGEATGGAPAYARVAVVWGAAAGTKANTGALAIDVPAGTYGFFTKWNAVSGNSGTQYLGHIPFGGAAAIKGFAEVDTMLTNDQLLSVAHGLADGDRVMLFNVFSETLPTGLVEGTVYFVVSSAANTFKVSLTSGGAAVDITAVGGGEVYWQKVVPEVFGAQGQVTAAVGALVLDAGAF